MTTELESVFPPHIYRTDKHENIYSTYFRLTDYFRKEYEIRNLSTSTSKGAAAPASYEETHEHEPDASAAGAIRVIVLMEVGAFFEMYATTSGIGGTGGGGPSGTGGGTLNETELAQCTGSEIAFFSRICDLKVAERTKSTYNGQKIVVAGFKNHLIDKYLSLLVANQCVVVVYEQEVADATSAGGSAATSTANEKKSRILTGIYSFGTHFTMETPATTNKTACVWVEICKPLRHGIGKGTGRNQEKIFIGVSCVDIFTGAVFCNEYSTAFVNVPSTFDELLNNLSVHQPSELLFIANAPEEQMKQWCLWCGISAKRVLLLSLNPTPTPSPEQAPTKAMERARKCEKQSYQYELIRTFYNIHDPAQFRSQFAEYTYITQSLCFLLDHLHQHNPHLVHRLSQPTLNGECTHLMLANHSLRQLHIIEDMNRTHGAAPDGPPSRKSCVLNWLNNCITPMGKRAFAHRLLHPTTNVAWLNEEYDIQDKWVHLWNARISSSGASPGTFWKQCSQTLQSIKDLERIYRLGVVHKITPRYIYQIHQGVVATMQWMDYLAAELTDEERAHTLRYLELRSVAWDALKNEMNALRQFLESSFYIEHCKWVDSLGKDIEKCGGKNYIRPGVSNELDNAVHTYGVAVIHLESYKEYFDDLMRQQQILAISSSNTSSSRKKNHTLTQSQTPASNTKTYLRLHRTEKNEVSLVLTDARCNSLMQYLKTAILPTNKFVQIPISYASLRHRDASDDADCTDDMADADADANWMDECEWNAILSKLPKTIPLDLTTVELSRRTSSSVAIVSPTILSACHNWKTAKQRMMTEMVTAFHKQMLLFHQYQPTIQHMNAFLVTMDILLCNVRNATQYRYCRPELCPSAEKSFVDAGALRHVLIEQLQHNELYVPNSIVLGKDGQDGVLLFGSNAVGKTSFIRSIGVAVIMAQAGLFVPAQFFRYKPYAALFTRILGNDDLHRGHSTFVVEMNELRSILVNGNANSLVLGDELCSGTDTSSAVSLFMSALNVQSAAKMSFIYATHLREITELEEMTRLPTVHCKHMEVVFNAELGCLVYNRTLQDGVGSDNSQALEVCKSMGMPLAFIEGAVEIRNRYYGNRSSGKGGSVLDAPTSRYCAEQVRNVCELCRREMADEVHHLQFQQHADARGIIQREGMAPFHKNKKANLMNVCEKCHDEMHTSGREYRRVKTLEHGYRIVPLAVATST